MSVPTDRALFYFSMSCFIWRSRIPELVTNCCSRRGWLGIRGNDYFAFSKRAENCGGCALLQTILTMLHRLAQQFWHFANLSPISKYCDSLSVTKCEFTRSELLNWRSGKLSPSFCRFRSMLIAAAPSVLFSWALLVTARFASLWAISCCCFSPLHVSRILSTFATWHVSSLSFKFSLPVGSLTSGRLSSIIWD